MTVCMFVVNTTCILIVILMQIPTNVVTEMAVVLKVATTQLAATIVRVALDILRLPIATVAMVSIMTKIMYHVDIIHQLSVCNTLNMVLEFDIH